MSHDLFFDKKRVVLGTAGLAGIWGNVDRQESVQTILFALESGITHFDAAPAYADAEDILGEALNQWHGTRPFISTKVGKLKSDNPDSVDYDFSPDAMMRSIDQSLNSLGVQKIDLLFLHDPTGLKEGEAQPAIDFLQKIKQDGIVDNIGIGGNYGQEFSPFVEGGGFDYFMGFNRFNLINQQATSEEFIVLDKANIQKWQASPLYMGLLGSKYHAYQEARPEWILPTHFNNAKIAHQFCLDNNIELPALALHFVLHASCIEKVVIGACNMEELKSTFHYLSDNNFNLNQLLIAYQNSIEQGN
jgi:aryl-alcohol dehydrogenase-like predicted oxidoreductase